MAAQSSAVLKMLQEMASKEVDLATEALAKAMKAFDEAKNKENIIVLYVERLYNN